MKKTTKKEATSAKKSASTPAPADKKSASAPAAAAKKSASAPAAAAKKSASAPAAAAKKSASAPAAAAKKSASASAASVTKVNMRISNQDKEALRDFAQKNKMTYSTCIDELLKMRWAKEAEKEITSPLVNKRKPKCNDFNAVKDSFIVFTMLTSDKKKLQKAAAKEGLSASMYLRKTIFR